MPNYPLSRSCPSCRSRDSLRHGSARVCRKCLTRYVVPDTADRILFGTAFIIPGLVFGAVGVFAFYGMASDPNSFSPACLACPGSAALLGLIAFCWGFREVMGRRKPPAPEADEPPGPAPALSRAIADKMVEWVENIYYSGDKSEQLGALRVGGLSSQIRWFAPAWEEDERPLFFLDTSRNGDGTAGILVSDRRLYASALDEAIPLADVRDVTCEEKGGTGGVLMILAILLLILCLFVGWVVILFGLATAAERQATRWRLLVNGKVLCTRKREFNTALWIDVFTSLGRAARDEGREGPKNPRPVEEAPAPQGITRHVGLLAASPGVGRAAPAASVLEALPHSPDGLPLDGEVIDDPSWEQVERSIREMDGHTHPLVRLWAGEPWKRSGLEIIGGLGKYTLREVGDGWVYYDPGGADEDVLVQTSGGGHRAAGYFVCTDVERVLRIARRFCETGAAGDAD
jgi:hypothetical protein